MHKADREEKIKRKRSGIWRDGLFPWIKGRNKQTELDVSVSAYVKILESSEVGKIQGVLYK